MYDPQKNKEYYAKVRERKIKNDWIILSHGDDFYKKYVEIIYSLSEGRTIPLKGKKKKIFFYARSS